MSPHRPGGPPPVPDLGDLRRPAILLGARRRFERQPCRLEPARGRGDGCLPAPRAGGVLPRAPAVTFAACSSASSAATNGRSAASEPGGDRAGILVGEQQSCRAAVADSATLRRPTCSPVFASAGDPGGGRGHRLLPQAEPGHPAERGDGALAVAGRGERPARARQVEHAGDQIGPDVVQGEAQRPARDAGGATSRPREGPSSGTTRRIRDERHGHGKARSAVVPLRASKRRTNRSGNRR